MILAVFTNVTVTVCHAYCNRELLASSVSSPYFLLNINVF